MHDDLLVGSFARLLQRNHHVPDDLAAVNQQRERAAWFRRGDMAVGFPMAGEQAMFRVPDRRKTAFPDELQRRVFEKGAVSFSFVQTDLPLLPKGFRVSPDAG